MTSEKERMYGFKDREEEAIILYFKCENNFFFLSHENTLLKT